MRRRYLVFAIPFVLALTSCSHVTISKPNIFNEDTLAHEEIFGDTEIVNQLHIKKHNLQNLDSSFVDIGYQTQYDNENDKISIRYVAALKDANVKAVWHRGVAKGDGTQTKAFNSGAFESKKIYKSLKNGNQIITAGEDDYSDYVGFIVYTLTDIPYTANADSYIGAYLSLTDLDNSSNSFNTNVYAIKIEKNADNTSKNLFNFASNINSYFLQGTFNGQKQTIFDDENVSGSGNRASYSNLELTENDQFGSFYFDGNSFQYFNYSVYYDNSLGFFDEASINGYVSPKLGGKYTLYVSNGNNTVNHVYTSASYFTSNITMWLKPGKWEKDGARFTIYSFNNNDSNVAPIWRKLAMDTKNSLYRIDNYDTQTYPDFIFCRMDGDDVLNNWDNVWNKTSDLSVSLLTGVQCCTVIGNQDPWPASENPSFQLYSELPNDIEIIDNGGFTNINDDEPFDIHTADQKEFLEYDGNYAHCPEDLYPNGKSHLSDSNPVSLSWDYTIPNGKTLSKYSVTFGQKADLSDGYIVNGTTSKSINLTNPYLGRNYYKITANFTDNSYTETPIRHFEVSSCYPRNLTIAGLTNCRDIGGVPLENGGRVKQGLIYRTSGSNKNGTWSSYKTAASEEMINHLGVKNEINLVGDSDKYNLSLNNVPIINSCRMDTSSTGGYSHFSRNTEAVKNFFNLLGNSSNYPLFYHCQIGTDRTGMCTVLLHGLLGVSLNDIYKDYLFSNFGKIGDKRTIGNGDSHDMLKYVNDILEVSGTTFKDKVYNLLLGIGVSRETLDNIISIMVEGSLANDYDKNQIIAPATALTSNGVSIIHDTSDRSHPDCYYTLDSSSKSVSYTFNVDKAFEGQIVAYLGNSDASTSLKIANAINCQLDDNNLAMIDQTYYEARLGHCTVNNVDRMNYYPVVISVANLSVGTHTIRITGTSNTMDIGGIYIFDNSTAGGESGY